MVKRFMRLPLSKMKKVNWLSLQKKKLSPTPPLTNYGRGHLLIKMNGQKNLTLLALRLLVETKSQDIIKK